MNVNLILMIMAIANALFAATLMVIFIFGKYRQTASQPEFQTAQYQSIKSGEQPTIVNTGESVPSNTNPGELDYSSKVKIALARLEGGIAPEIIANDFGFSDSEMNVLVASANRERRSTLQNETSQSMQK
jgi:hypothetical protein